MDLRALRYFVHVAEARSFSKAALQLRVAQPALSRQVRKLEDELGVELILRSSRQIELTEPGLLLLQRAHSLMRQARQMADDVRAHGSSVRGTMTLGVSPSTCDILGPLIVRECAIRHPELRLNFVEGVSGYIFNRLVAQELTLCLMHNPPRHQGIEIQPLLTERMYLVGPGPRSGGLPPAMPRMKLDRVPLILPNGTHALRMMIERAVAEEGGELNVAVQVDGFATTKALVAAGLGYTVLPYSSVREQVENGELSAAYLRTPDMSWTLSVAYRRDQRTALAVKAVRDVIAIAVDSMRAGMARNRAPAVSPVAYSAARRDSPSRQATRTR
jgi:LysR family transcriptional regulator, nitrogen assimilation regulatory protein